MFDASAIQSPLHPPPARQVANMATRLSRAADNSEPVGMSPLDQRQGRRLLGEWLFQGKHEDFTTKKRDNIGAWTRFNGHNIWWLTSGNIFFSKLSLKGGFRHDLDWFGPFGTSKSLQGSANRRGATPRSPLRLPCLAVTWHDHGI